MDKELAETIVEAIENDNGNEARIYENYSGRGMYGSKTTGVVAKSMSSIMSAIINNAHILINDDNEPKYNVGDFRSDNLGYDIIVY